MKMQLNALVLAGLVALPLAAKASEATQTLFEHDSPLVQEASIEALREVRGGQTFNRLTVQQWKLLIAVIGGSLTSDTILTLTEKLSGFGPSATPLSTAFNVGVCNPLGTGLAVGGGMSQGAAIAARGIAAGPEDFALGFARGLLANTAKHGCQLLVALTAKPGANTTTAQQDETKAAGEVTGRKAALGATGRRRLLEIDSTFESNFQSFANSLDRAGYAQRDIHILNSNRKLCYATVLAAPACLASNTSQVNAKTRDLKEAAKSAIVYRDRTVAALRSYSETIGLYLPYYYLPVYVSVSNSGQFGN